MVKKTLAAMALIATLTLTGCVQEPAPIPNPTRSAQNDQMLQQQTDDFSKVALESLRKATPALGMTESDAVSFIEGLGLTARVIERDGEVLVIDQMYSNSRIDLYILRNIVIDITVG